MNVTVISLSILLISYNVHTTSGIFLFSLRFLVAQDGYMNSFFNSEIIIEGTKAEDIYFMERGDQLKKLDNALKKRAKLVEKKKSAKKLSIFDLNPAKAGLKAANVGRLKYQLSALDEKIEKRKIECHLLSLQSNRFILILVTGKFCNTNIPKGCVGPTKDVE